MDNKLTNYLCSYKKVYSTQILLLQQSSCTIRCKTAIPHCACNTDDTKTEARRRRVGKAYRNQQELKFTFRTEQWNFSLFTAMRKTVDAVQLSWNRKKINDNNCHTANGDDIHSLQFC